MQCILYICIVNVQQRAAVHSKHRLHSAMCCIYGIRICIVLCFAVIVSLRTSNMEQNNVRIT